ncbi:RNA polymerase sigma factor [Leifsonia sp. RAF41]|uniref:RNA polymerase sigma factor n=1 Tax=Leifsonia sp. RAF41 TaxID=3233056 RepID=UPI003F9AA1C1
MRNTTAEASSDADLVASVREGDDDAAARAELWRRHAAAGRAMAGSITDQHEPEDLVSEAFTRIFALIRRGEGLEGAFRSWLYESIRHVSTEWSGEIAPQPLDTLQLSEESTLAALDRSLTVTAFRTLPTRWQEALWYTEIEQLTPRQLAPILGMDAANVSELTLRAREGLRQGWMRAQIASVREDYEHAWALSAEVARQVGSRLTQVLLPLSAGIAGSVGYTAWLQRNGPS